MSSVIPVVVFSNLDDVLAHPDDKACAYAGRELSGLEREYVSLVLCSSKTRAEIEAIQQALDIRHPFVCEGGSAAFVPNGYFPFDVPDARPMAGYQAIELGRPYADVVETIRRVASRQKVNVASFSDMSVEEVARDCQLSLLQARLAKLREYDERFRVLDESPAAHQRLIKALEGAHLRCYGNERYHHASTALDPRLAVSLLHALYRRSLGAVLSLGASDATAPFADRPLANSSRASQGEAVLVEWAYSIVDLVGRLRARESPQTR